VRKNVVYPTKIQEKSAGRNRRNARAVVSLSQSTTAPVGLRNTYLKQLNEKRGSEPTSIGEGFF